MGDCC